MTSQRGHITDITITYDNGRTESWTTRLGAFGHRSHVTTYVEADSKKVADRRAVEYVSITLPLDVDAVPAVGRVVVAAADLRHAIDCEEDGGNRHRLALARLHAALLREAMPTADGPATVPS